MHKPYGLRAVKLTEIPRDERLRAARRAAKECHDSGETCSLIVAALFPSDRVYFVRAQALGELSAAA